VLKIEWVAEDRQKMKQQTLAMANGFERYTKKTRRTLFLEEMEQVVPWAELCALVEPVYAKVGNGRPPVGAERLERQCTDIFAKSPDTIGNAATTVSAFVVCPWRGMSTAIVQLNSGHAPTTQPSTNTRCLKVCQTKILPPRRHLMNRKAQYPIANAGAPTPPSAGSSAGVFGVTMCTRNGVL